MIFVYPIAIFNWRDGDICTFVLKFEISLVNNININTCIKIKIKKHRNIKVIM